jgi:hypothetical protein
MYYVTMTDKFMSGWGMAQGKKNKLVFICDTYEEAEIVEQNATNRNDMKYINVTSKKPYYNSNEYYVQIKTKEEYPTWYQRGYFRG